MTRNRSEPDRSLLYRAGSWAASHPRQVLAVWGLLLVVAVFSAGNFTSRISAQSNEVDGSDSAQAGQVLREAFPDAPTETDFVVLHSPSRGADDPAFRAVVRAALERYRAAGVAGVTSPYDRPDALISADGRTALVLVDLRGPAREIQQAADRFTEIAAELSTDRVQVYFTGYSPLAAASIERAGQDLTRAESIGFPLAALILLLAFGSVVAAAIPLTLGITAILASFGLLGMVAFAVDFSTITRAAVTMLAIALGIDYSLFIVTRFREELAARAVRTRTERVAAVGRAMATSGRAVIFSGTTVMISLGGLFLVRSPGLRSMAIGMMVGVLAMLALSTTLLPAILGLLGARVNRIALPWARASLAQPDPEHSGWARLTAVAMRRPATVAVGATVLLGVLAAPALGLQYGVDTGARAVDDTPAGQGFALVSTSFAPGMVAPLNVVARTEAGALSPAQLDAISRFAGYASHDDRVASVTAVTTVLDDLLGGHGADQYELALDRAPDALGALVNREADTTTIVVNPVHAADTGETRSLVTDLRADAVPLLTDAGLVAHVGGNPAQIVDIMAENARATPLVIGAVLAASWLLLLVVFRSLVLPFKAILVNLLSVGAAFGTVVLVFQEGYGAGLLGVDRTGFIQVMLPLLAFAVAFGLSMDYEVFMVSRMREEWDRTGDNPAAVRLGITRTARVITSAALIMVAVFASFVLASMLETKQLGFMLALIVLIDATIVRLFLVPALMRMLGRWNWWLPALPDRLARRSP